MTRVLPFSSKLGFGVGQAAEGITLVVFGSYTLFFFNQILEISAALTGLALGIALFCDAITDPLAGSISDRLQTRWGRRHPMIALSAVPLGVCVIALFNPPAGMSELFYFGWLVVFAVLSRLFLTLYHIPHLALGAEMAQDYVDRTRVFAYSQLFGTLGSMGFSFMALSLFFPTTDDAPHGMLNRAGYLPFALTAAVGIVSSIALFMWGTLKEIPHLPVARFAKDERLTPKRLLGEVQTAFRNRSYLMLFSGLLFAVILLGIEAVFMVYMYVHFWGLETESMRWIGPTAIAALPISIVMAPILTRKFDKRRILILLSSIIIVNTNVMICLRLFTDVLPGNGTAELLYLLLTFAFIGGLAGPAVMVTLNSMFADIADEQELLTGNRQEGIIFSARSFAFKAAGALASVIGGIALDLISFPRGAAPGDVADDTLFMLGLVAGPMTSIFGLINLSFYLGYKLTRERVTEIQAELVLRREQATVSGG
jgi:GPH family glycoside/pentoside/hexuronide:cation symporter